MVAFLFFSGGYFEAGGMAPPQTLVPLMLES
jgi:hypothetical protein